ncbi:lipopolysaccharide transport periplasmic protein LptA [Persephonella sp.]|uniref:lipopolysaccharide transport periplasmic protein LptA n=1 Tax=Persephonella sp. TaxID=2060922 RepID=UPI0025E43420|nr:lipopolysaccharide transport periplasmic protein LptA [Persephonella sp.]
MFRIFLIFLLFSHTVFGMENKKEPVVIEADTLEYLKKNSMIIYKGNVVVKKGDFTLKSDLLKIFLDEKGDIKKIIATGNVRFVKGNRKGKSEKAEYFKDKNYLILLGNAELQQNSNIIEGDEIVYYLDTEKAEVKGKHKRVRSIFFPEEKGKEK